MDRVLNIYRGFMDRVKEIFFKGKERIFDILIALRNSYIETGFDGVTNII